MPIQPSVALPQLILVLMAILTAGITCIALGHQVHAGASPTQKGVLQVSATTAVLAQRRGMS